jgi:hypothetical protein
MFEAVFQIVAVLDKPPQQGYVRWTGPPLAEAQM